MESVFKHLLAEETVRQFAVEYRGEEDCCTTASDAVMDGL
jgi:hypothetical protein